VDASGAKDECAYLADGKACGPDAPTLAFNLAMMLTHHAGDGGKKARLTREHEIDR
jgi:hypothetical protein